MHVVNVTLHIGLVCNASEMDASISYHELSSLEGLLMLAELANIAA